MKARQVALGISRYNASINLNSDGWRMEYKVVY